MALIFFLVVFFFFCMWNIMEMKSSSITFSSASFTSDIITVTRIKPVFGVLLFAVAMVNPNIGQFLVLYL